jgi:2-amino-4-hydroxy-6-hydroxymethyldihydropteridine diphosphokinase
VDAYVSIGSNIDREANIVSAVAALRARFGALQLSRVYDSPAVGFDGADFFNLVAGFQTSETASELVDALRDIERRHGRRRDGDSFDDRTLDIDLLLYGNMVSELPGLVLPRDEITDQPHVLKPLLDVLPDGVDPRSGERLTFLWTRLNHASANLQLSPVNISL